MDSKPVRSVITLLFLFIFFLFKREVQVFGQTKPKIRNQNTYTIRRFQQKLSKKSQNKVLTPEKNK